MQAVEMNAFRDLWANCPSCHQEYQNELSIDIANKFVSFVRRQYPDDTRMQVESLHLKLCALDNLLDRLKPVQKREAGITANVLLSLIDRMKGDASPLSRRYSQFQSDAYNVHGCIAFDEGTEESARRAVVHFEMDLKVCKAISNVEGILFAKSNIRLAKSMYEEVERNTEEELTANQEVYELRVAELGEENEYTIDAGVDYARDLHNANRRKEARELLIKLLATSKQVLGSHHNMTKEVELELQRGG
jgi:hypothetical protein